MSDDKATTIWCKRSTHQWFTRLADRRPHDAFLRRLLTLWDSVTATERERLMRGTGNKETDDDR